MSNNFSYILERLSSRAQRVLVAAQKLSENHKHAHTGTEHLLFGILTEKNAFGSEILLKNNFTASDIEAAVVKLNKDKVSEVWSAKISENFRQSLEKAAVIASRYNYAYIATEHLLFGVLDCEECSAAKILQNKLNPKDLKDQLSAIFEHSSKFPDFLGVEEQLPAKDNVKALPSEKISKSPALDYFALDLTERARLGKIDPCIGRSMEIERVVSILNRRNKNNPVLIGEPGVGKTAIVEGLALAVARGEVPESLSNSRILALDLALIVAGSMFRGEFENRLKQVIEEVSEDKNIILFIDELHTLVGAGATTGSLDAANILKPALARGDLRAIGATTLSEYKKYIENDAALERRFQQVMVDEPSPEETLQIINGVLANYEKHHNVTIAPEAVEAAVELSTRYIPDRFLPDKALDLIDETAAGLKTRNESSPQAKFIQVLEAELNEIASAKTRAVLSQNYAEASKLRARENGLRKSHQEALAENIKNHTRRFSVTGQDIARTVSRLTKIPVHNLIEAEIDKLVNLEKALKKRIISQEDIVAAAADTIRRSRLGLSSPARPMGSFVFMGPSGVGKTELAKTLAAEIFQSSNSLIRVDMSEFMEKHNVSRLIGAPAGYVGYEEGGRLTEAVRRKPYAMVLFDEIEKAHPDVFNLLLQILEEGELTDAAGKKVSFRNTIIIMTSNIGLDDLNREAAGFGFVEGKALSEARQKFEEVKEQVVKSLKEIMRPELINRIDKILVFKPLELAHIKKITELQLDVLQKRLLARKINLSWDKKAVEILAKKSLNANEGARLVRRNLQEMVEVNIANHLLRNKEHLNNSEPVKIKISGHKESLSIKFLRVAKTKRKTTTGKNDRSARLERPN